MKTTLFRAMALALAIGAGASGNLHAQAAQRAGAPAGKDAPAVKGRDGYGLAEARKDFRQLALEEDEVRRIKELLDSDSRELGQGRAEIRELQARLARLMLDEKPDKAIIEKTVRQSLEVEFRIRMAQIDRNLALRELLGDRRWAALSRLSRAFAVLARNGDLRGLAEKTGDSEKLARLFEVLRSLQ
jgi:hypothetical protein